ncbi:MAG: N-acetyltransferase [Pedobacter sp.]|jgi:ribosomal protein S18 acetylase RimI-like enzyme|nr:N-acetyltransferase [Pedobacter sp.]
MESRKDSFVLERIHISNLEDLQIMSRETFYDAFFWGTSPENMKTYLETSLSEEKLSTELNQSQSQFYFAVLNNFRVGYLKLNFGQAQTELRESSGMEIERIYVLKEHQGKKIGQELINKAIDIAVQNKMEYVWLGVWEKNTKAISFYQRNGFVEISAHPFMMGTEEQVDLIMKRSLIV